MDEEQYENQGNVESMIDDCPGNIKQAYYTGNSMRGMFEPGDMLILEKKPFDSLECGDIVAVFDRTPHYVHRVIDKTRQTAVTMGDNNDRPDTLPLTKNNRFLLVEGVIPVGTTTGIFFPVAGGFLGMRQFHRQQRIRRTIRIILRIIREIRLIGRFRIPAKMETRFRDGTIQWSFGKIPVAARNPLGQTKYLSSWKRLFFRIPKGRATASSLKKQSEQAESAKQSKQENEYEP